MADLSQVKEITERLEQGVKDLFESDRYADYLKTMSRFHNYSTRNTVLIHLQKPDASLVAGFGSWRTKFGRHVKKGAKSIKIMAPTPFTIREEKEILDPATRLPVLDGNGMPVFETIEKKLARFKVVSVFDVSDTAGKPIPSLAGNLIGNVEQYEAFMDALRAVSPLPIVFEPMPEDTDGTCYFGDRLAIREGMSEIQTVSAVIHEMAHSKLHDLTLTANGGENAVPKDRHTEEVEAESISYSICQYFSIETGENSFGYLASWSKNKELKELNASLDTIRKTAAELIGAIDGKFQEIVKERNIVFTVGEDQESLHEQYEPDADGLSTEDQEKSSLEPRLEEDDMPAPETSEPETTEMSELDLSLPDPTVSANDRDAFGYLENNMLPMANLRAVELFDTDHAIFLLYPDNTEALAFDRNEILNHEGLCGIERADWENSPVLAAQLAIANNAEGRREAEFLYATVDMFGIYQIKGGEEMRDYLFEAHARLKEQGLSVNRGNYELIHTVPISDLFGRITDKNDFLNQIYETFNHKHPEGYTGRSISVSDVIAIKYDGEISSHYVNSFGFTELPDFLGEETQKSRATEIPAQRYSQVGNTLSDAPDQSVPTVAELRAEVNAGKAISLSDLSKAVNAERRQTNRSSSPKGKPTLMERLENGKRKMAQQNQSNGYKENNREDRA